jgi:hypothetical protein
MYDTVCYSQQALYRKVIIDHAFLHIRSLL